MFIICSPESECPGVAVNLAACPAFGPCGPDIVVEKPSGKRTVVASYADKERAQEVYLDMLDKYQEFWGNGVYEGALVDHPWAFTPPKVYKMPEE